MSVGGFLLGNMSGQECTFSYMYTCIGYKLPTFGEYMLVGGFLCALRAQGWVICLVRNVHFLLCIPDNFTADKFPFGQLPPGQVPLPGKLPPGQVPPDKFPFGQVPPRGNLSGGQLSGGKLSASHTEGFTDDELVNEPERIRTFVTNIMSIFK